MNKANLISAINAFITAVITQTKVRNAYLELVNAIFQTTTTQTDVSGSNKFYYTLRYKKVGNLVYIDGWVQNKFSVAKTATNILTIPNALFYGKTGQDTRILGTSESTNSTIQMAASGSTLYLLGTIAPNEKVYINQHYQTND